MTSRPLDCHKTLSGNSQDQNSYGIADEIGDDIGECDFLFMYESGNIWKICMIQ